MNIELAKSAGFCFGVQRAINIIYDALDQNKKICTLGHIIHNRHMIDELSNKGVRVINNIEEVKKDETIVIRSHGVSQNIYDKLLNKQYLDGTCPFVSKIHKIVSSKFIDENTKKNLFNDQIFIIIIGDKKHPEIKGIEGSCIYRFATISNPLELENYINTNINLKDKNIKVVSQTTFSTEEFDKCINIIKSNFKNYEIFNTICNETKKRQSEAENLSKIKDLMIVVGDKNSSNTQKLFNVCNKNCTTILIESFFDLNKYNLNQYQNIGVTAGASTPSDIIKDVMENLKKNNIQNNKNIKLKEENINFEKEILSSDDSYNLSIGAEIKGIVTKINNKEAAVDIGNQYDAYIPFNEITDNKNLKIDDIIKPGDKLDLMIIKINDDEGIITLSKKRVDKIKANKKIKEAYYKKLPVEGVVTKILNDGIIVSVSGINVYIHQSQTGVNKDKLNDLLNQKVEFKITSIDPNNKNIKGSIKELKKEKFWSNINVGDCLTGTVKDLTNFGAFIDLDGEDGLIFISDLSWNKIKHPSEILKIGQIVDVEVKHIDFDKKRVSLIYKKPENNPWNIIKQDYKIGDIVNVTIISITPFGAFAEIIPGVDGLIHISEISDVFVKSVKDFLTVGQKVSAKIKEINFDKKKISLSLKLDDNKLDINNNDKPHI